MLTSTTTGPGWRRASVTTRWTSRRPSRRIPRAPMDSAILTRSGFQRSPVFSGPAILLRADMGRPARPGGDRTRVRLRGRRA